MADTHRIAAAYTVLGLELGVSPLAARRRYRALVKEWHPDRHPAGSHAQLAATRRMQELTDAYHTIKQAAVHREVPLRPPRATPASPGVPAFDLSVDTWLDRVVAGTVGVLLGGFIALALMSESVALWVGLPLLLGAAGAVFGWRAIEAVLRILWRFV